MKFIFADALDMIDPYYDFLNDRESSARDRYWHDQYPHEYFKTTPYDGILISLGIVGSAHRPGKYSLSQLMRLRRAGARKFLRLDKPKFKDVPIFGDCGAFSYHEDQVPPYTTDDVIEFYGSGQFSHGCSVDHVIFDFETQLRGLKGGTTQARERFEITQQNAQSFLRASKFLGRQFTPLGVIQGWSPSSMAVAACNLERMGYRYLAVGGIVPLSSASIHLCLQAIRESIKPTTKLHILGFAKAEEIQEFSTYGIASFDSTSPLIRAFRDARANYYMLGRRGLEYYTAIRIPQATENSRLMRRAKRGDIDQEAALLLEKKALKALRAFGGGQLTVGKTIAEVLPYSTLYLWDQSKAKHSNHRRLATVAAQMRRTLEARPWEQCSCRVCREAGIEAVIFRSSNRNKRRGFHNLAVYYEHLNRVGRSA